MLRRDIQSLIIPGITACTILAVSAGVIAYGRGYRPVFGQKNIIKPTGLLSANSDPVGSRVYVNGVLKTATNNSFNIDPGSYTIRIAKQGYQSWEKKLEIQTEVVTQINPFLFPVNPSLSPLTNLGVINPTLSPDGTKIVYIIPQLEKAEEAPVKAAGVWVYELIDRPLGLNRDPRQIATVDTTFDMAKATCIWSPDSTQLLLHDGITTRLYQINKLNDFQIVTAIQDNLLAQWDEERSVRDKQKLASFKQPVIDMATSSAKIISFSPDETKLLYEATTSATIPQIIKPALVGTNSTPEQRTIQKGKWYVYDSREDKNYFLLDRTEIPTLSPTLTPSPTTRKTTVKPIKNTDLPIYSNPIHWFPTNRHLVLTLPGKIDIMEYDRTNWITVYSGPFTDGFIAPWPNGSRIIVLTNLNPGALKLPNLYTVNLR